MDEITLKDLFAIWRRRRSAFFITAMAVFLLSAIGVFSWSRYQSTATVQIQQPDIPESMTAPAGMSMSQVIRALADQRIQQIEEKVASSATLVDIVTKFNLYADDRRAKPMEAVIKNMRKRIKLKLLTEADTDGSGQSAPRAPGDKSDTIAFTLQFTYSNPLVAQQVNNELVSRFLDEDLKQRRAQAQSTAAFMDQQIKDIEASMSEQEAKIEDFRSKHPDSRPESLMLNQQLAANTFQNLQQLDASIATLERTRGDLRTQLVTVDPYSRVVADGQLVTTPSIQLRALQAKYSTLIAQYSIDHPDVVRLRHQIEALQNEVGQTQDTAELQSQLVDARTNLAAAEKTYGPDHPDVLSLRRKVANLENQLALMASDPTPHMAIKKDADNPAYLMLKQQMDAVESQYKSLVDQRDALRKQYDHYTQIVATLPGLEQEFAALSRDYDNAQLRYRELKEKKMSADMNEQMEQGRKAERLVVVDPPDLPSDTAPRRILLLAAGIVLSVFGGGVGAASAEILQSDRVHGTRHLARLIGEMPLAVVPHIFTAEERRKLRRRRIQLGAASVAGGVLLIFLFNEFVMPLDVLWSIVTTRFGLT